MIQVTDSLVPKLCVPLDARTVVNSVRDFSSIPWPYTGLLVYVKDVDKYARIKTNDEDEIESYEFLNNSSFIIEVTKSGETYSSDMSSLDIYDTCIASSIIPTVKCEGLVYNAVAITEDICKFASVQNNSTSILTVENNVWQLEEFELQAPAYYCTITKSGNTYTCSRNYAQMHEVSEKGISVFLLYQEEIYSQIYDDGDSIMMFATVKAESNGIKSLDVFKINNSTVTYLTKELSPIAGYNKLGLTKTNLENPDTQYMLPVAINSSGFVFNGLNIVEVNEPGLYVVDKNMDAGFSSLMGNVVINSGTVIQPEKITIPEDLEERISSVEEDVSTISASLSGITLKIEN